MEETDNLDIINHRFDTVYSNRNTIGTNFSGSVNFQTHLTSDQYCPNAQNCFFTINGLITLPVAGATTIAGGSVYFDNTAYESTTPASTTLLQKNIHFTQAPVGALLTTGTLTVNDTEASRIQNAPVHLMHQKLLYESLEYQPESGNPLFPYDLDTQYISLQGTNIVPVALLGNIAEGRKVNAGVIYQLGTEIYDATLSRSAQTVLFMLSFPFPFFQSATNEPIMIPPNSRINVEFLLDSAYYKNFICGLWDGVGLTASSIDFTRFTLNMELAHSRPPKNLKLNQRFIETYSDARNWTSNSIQLTCPSSSRRIAVSFRRAVSSRPTANPTTAAMNDKYNYCLPVNPKKTRDVTAALATANANERNVEENILKRFYITFNGEQYPKAQYDFYGNTSDWRRAYDAYIRYSRSFENGEQNVIKSFKNWCVHPIFVFDITGQKNISGNSQLYIYTEMDSGTTNGGDYDIMTTVEYVKELELSYNADGLPESTQVYTIA